MEQIAGSFTISSFVESVENPFGRFRTLDIDTLQRDVHNRARLWCGSKAAIFKVMCGGQPKMLKCYFGESPRNAQVAHYFEKYPNANHLRYEKWLADEMYIYNFHNQGAYRNVALADWVEGRSLDYEIRKAAITQNRQRLEQLAQMFRNLAVWLLAQEWSHGDIKPENIIVCGEQLVLIDYDAVYIPLFEGQTTDEIGTPTFQHPARDQKFFNKHTDDYPIALVLTLLHGLCLDPTLYDQRLRNDLCLLSPVEILEQRSAAYEKIIRLMVEHGQYTKLRLAEALHTELPTINNLAQMVAEIDLQITPKGELSLFEQDGKWGYMDSEGQPIITPIYNDALEFRQGLAAVYLRGVWQYIDTTGRMVINRPAIEKVKSFHEGLAAVRIGAKWGYIDQTGTIVIEPQFEMASSMRDGKAKVTAKNGTKYVDKYGDWIAKPQLDNTEMCVLGQNTTKIG